MSAALAVAVVGLGKIGLTLAAQYASRGLSVIGCDINAALVDTINNGECPIDGEEGLEERLAIALREKRLTATIDIVAAVATSDVVIVIVPVGLTGGQTPDDQTPDFTHLDAAVADVARGLRPDTLVVVETTVPVGTTRGRVGKALADAGHPLLLAASPERVSSGHIFRDLRAYPKVIGAIDEASWTKAEAFYSAALEAPSLLRVRDPETAEFSKLAEGIYRDVNIALAGELARYADAAGVDVTEVIDAANSQPYSHLHQPGVGVGGHCLPVYPYFLPADSGTKLPLAAREINDGMAAYGVSKLEQALGSLEGATVLVLGLAYRPNVKEASHSSALLITEALRARGATALIHDPLYSDAEITALGLDPVAGLPPEHTDAVIVQAWHDAYQDLDFATFSGCKVVLDGRNALNRERVEAAGVRYLGIGR
ncbi:MAG: nucleotide sugar dehydrogenase [Chloroflexi bacterium]|nr:nucleotide sugar dehydrogenase [Chloroflexota bacterium]